MRTSHTALSTLALSGGLALALAGPAQAAVPTSACDSSTTFAVSAAPGVDATTVTSLTEALEARGFSPAPASAADLTASVAPASEIAASGSPTVMAVAIGEGDLDPATASEGSDWVGITADAKGAANQLLDGACGPLPAPDEGTSDSDNEPAPEETAPEPSAGPTQPAAPAAPAEREAPAAEPAAPAATQSPAAEPAAPAAKQSPAAESAAAPARQQGESSTASAAEASGAEAAGSASTGEASASASSSSRTTAAGGATGAADKDCGDFGSQGEAQDFFEDQGGPQSDRHRLDADGDGLACETSGGESAGPAAVAVAGPASEATGSADTSGATGASDKDCPDFASQAEAQTFFTDNGGPASDRHRLDADDDGQACEDHFGGDNASRVQARTISAGTPEAGGIAPAGLAGGALLVGAGVALGLRARRG